MFEIIIKMPDRPETVGQLLPGTYRIGSSPAAHIQIKRPEVSARHALLTVDQHGVEVEDAGSTNGSKLDGRPLSDRRVPFPAGSVLTLGDATIELRDQNHAGTPSPKREASAPPPPVDAHAAAAAPAPLPISGPRPGRPRVEESVEMLMLSGIRYEYRKVVQVLKRKVHKELIERLNLRNLAVAGADGGRIREEAQATIRTLLGEYRDEIPRGVEMSVVEQELTDEAIGLGPVERLLANPDITEIMINGGSNIYVEKRGAIYRTDMAFADDTALLTAIDRIVAPLGRRIDESQPLVDARLPDGSRVNAIIPPLAIDGPTLTIRKFSRDPFTVDMLVDMGSMTHHMAAFLQLCVLVRKNILISGGTGSGKTTLLNVVSNYLPNSERIVTIEDAAELQLNKDHVVRLEARPPNIEGRGEIAIRDLVRNSLRMRPDRIVIGECRGGEALDMLQAMNTGHDGSLTTVHANTARDALARLETLVLMAGFDLPLRAIREQIASAISLIVQIGRLRDGTRKVLSITEVTGMEGDILTTQDIFEYEIDGLDEEGKVRGRHVACGIVPTFLEEFRLSGQKFDMAMFQPPEDQK